MTHRGLFDRVSPYLVFKDRHGMGFDIRDGRFSDLGKHALGLVAKNSGLATSPHFDVSHGAGGDSMVAFQ